MGDEAVNRCCQTGSFNIGLGDGKFGLQYAYLGVGRTAFGFQSSCFGHSIFDTILGNHILFAQGDQTLRTAPRGLGF